MSAAPSKCDGLCRASAEEILRGARPLALVLCGLGGLTAAPERVFDTGPGELLVQRVAGAIAGRRGGELQRCLEYLARAPPLLLVLGDVRDDCAQTALNQALGLQGLHRCADAQLVLDQLAPAAIRALELHAPEARDGRDDQRAREEELVCEVARQAVLSAVERLLSDSEALRGLVRKCQLALEDAVVQQGGEVAFLGPHERQAELLALEPVAERARRLRYNVLST